MKKRGLISCVVLTLVMILSCVMALGVSAATGTVTMTAVDGGAAIGGNVVTISTADELYLLRDYVAEGNPTAGVTFRLENNIALPEPGSTLRGQNNTEYSNSPDIGTEAAPFKGVFEGNGKKITNLTISKKAYLSTTDLGEEDAEGRGLFAYTDGATIQNLTVSIKKIQYASLNLGGIVGSAKNTILTHCAVDGAATKSGAANTRVQKNVGGLVGLADASTLNYCSADVMITGLENVGGLVGYAKNGTKLFFPKSSSQVGYATQQDPATAPVNFGGIVGKLEGSSVENALVLDASLYAKDAAKDANVVGGIAGAMDATSSIKNALVKVSVEKGDGVTYDPVVGSKDFGGAVENIYSSASAPTVARTFDSSTFKLSSSITVAGKAADNAFTALNLYIEANQAGYPEQNVYWTTSGALVTCTSHARAAGSFACEDGICAVCSLPVAHTEEHRRPAGAKDCAEGLKCEICNKVPMESLTDHTLPAGTPACKEGVTCSECNAAVAPTAKHKLNSRVDFCLEAHYCTVCGKVEEEAPGHDWQGQTCVKAATCTRCTKTNPDMPATGDHIADRKAPTCTDAVKCVVCTRVLRDENNNRMDALGHDESGEGPTCGKAKKCLRCGEFLANATGEHTVDWTTATVDREPTFDVAGKMTAVCSVCGKTQEKYTKYVAPDTGDGEGGAGDGNTGDGNTGDGNTGENTGLPTGALIGIIAGAVVVVGGVTATVIVLSKKKKKGAALDTDNADE